MAQLVALVEEAGLADVYVDDESRDAYRLGKVRQSAAQDLSSVPTMERA